MNENLEPTWYKQEGEADSAYEKFDIYRKLPMSKRSMTEVMRLSGLQSTTQLYLYAKEYKWDERARAWDNYRVAQEDELIIKQSKEVKLEYLQEAKLLRKVLFGPVRSLAKKMQAGGDFDDKSMTELNKMVNQIPNNYKKLQEIELTALGEASEIKKEDITSNGNTIKITLTDD